MRQVAAALALFALSGCGGPEPDYHGPEPVGQSVQAVTVADAVNGGCSTTAVWGLSSQIIEQMNCLIPGGALAEVPARSNFDKGPATLAWMQPPAVNAFVAALDEMPGTTLSSDSMLRTVAQQYLLYRWYQLNKCSISLAATPGNSNHESGLAVDVVNHATWQATLEAHGFSWLGASDPVHFDFAGAGSVDLSGKDVLAFQQLWNLNNPSDPIAEDGDYGTETATRLEASPADGFAIPPSCGQAGSGGNAGAGGFAGASGSGGTGGAAGAATSGGSGGSGATAGAAPSQSLSDSGCGCRSAPLRSRGVWFPLAALLVTFGIRRRRDPARRCRASGRRCPRRLGSR